MARIAAKGTFVGLFLGLGSIALLIAGALASLYPAARAASLSPAEALRTL